MIVHVVMFEFKEHDKEKNMLKVKELLEALPAKIEGLVNMEVGIDFNKSERAFDMSLYSTFETKHDLQTYATHPAHLEVLEFIKQVINVSKVVDYEK